MKKKRTFERELIRPEAPSLSGDFSDMALQQSKIPPEFDAEASEIPFNSPETTTTPPPTEPTVDQNPVQRQESENLSEDMEKAPDGAGVGEKKSGMPEWLKERLEAGRNFDKQQAEKYPYNQVYLIRPGKGPEQSDKKTILDSYDPDKKEIVSRKMTQLNKVNLLTAFAYLHELPRKYTNGSQIAEVDSATKGKNKGVFKGGRKFGKLRGKYFLEVPPQEEPKLKPEIEECANRLGVVVRDTEGTKYNSPDGP